MKITVSILFFLLLLSLHGYTQGLTANFKTDITSGCTPIVVNFQDLSTGSPLSWKWDFGNGATSTKQNPSTTYFTSGSYTITLTVNNANGSHTVTKDAYISVFDQPKPDFASDKREGCAPTKIQFRDLSTPGAGTSIISWKWDFGDGGTSAEPNPLYAYKIPGTYTTSLTITTDKGCTKVITYPEYITVKPGVLPRFSFSDPSVCSAPATINFTNASTGPGTLTYSWNLGNGVTSSDPDVSTVYAANGTYKISLYVESSLGCSDSTLTTIDIGKVNTDITVPDRICPETTVQFINNSTPRPIKAFWEFSNGKTDTTRNTFNSFATGGTYTVTLINKYTACTDTFTKSFTVLPAPAIDFKASDTAKCQPPLAVNFATGTSGTSYTWNFGDGATSNNKNPSHTYTKLGEYDVSLIVTGENGCTDTLQKPGYIKLRKPTITFPGLPAKGCLPLPLTFSANIVLADTVRTYKWDFGDGVGTSTLEKPSYSYTKTGTYTVTLTITTSSGCTETFTLPGAVRVGTKPTADFTSDINSACASDSIRFTNLSSVPSDEWVWIFGDGTTSTLKNPAHVFVDTGWLDVQLIAFNNGCPSDTMTKPDFVNIKPPVARFEYQPNCSNKLEYSFVDKSIGALTWQWNFGDGSPVHTGKNPPAHLYPKTGSYTVTLTTTNGSCSFTVSRIIHIIDNTPDFTATVTTGCRPLYVVFTPSSPNTATIKSYLWDFGNGKTMTVTNPDPRGLALYSGSGNFDVSLTTIDSFGCKDVKLKAQYIKIGGPTAGFTSVSKSGCKGLTTTFTDTTKTDGASKIIKWKWDFGDGTVQTFNVPPFQHRYDSIGDFDVKLVVTDEKGCMDSISYREFVKISAFKIGFSTSGLSCPGAPIGFNNQTLSDLPITSSWAFGDGQTSTLTSPSHTYTDTGFYSVQLKVRDILGCEDSVTKQGVVQIGLPKASFTANNWSTFCTPFEAKFTNTSTFYQSSSWDLSIAKSVQTNPSLYYTKTGVYPVKLTVTSPGGCKDSYTDTLKVFSPSDAKLSYTPLNGCTPLLVKMEAFTEMNASFVWDFGDGNVQDTTGNKVEHVYRDFGDFTPKIILREPSGICVVTVTGGEAINILGVKAKYTLDKTFFCDSGRVTVLDSTTFNDPVKEYKWNFGDGTTYNTAAPVHQYTSPGMYNVSLVVNTQAGCTDTLQKGPIRVSQSPQFTLRADSVICVGDRVSYTATLARSDTAVIKWAWNFPNGNTAQTQVPPIQQYNTPGNYAVTAMTTKPDGCADTVVQTLKVNPLPIITAPEVMTKVVGVPLTIPATYSDNVINYIWTPAATLNCRDCPQPVTTAKFNTKYNVVAIDSNGCKNTADVQLIVTCKGSDLFVPNTFSPNGDGTNDVFMVRGRGLDRVKSLRVFNRWGEVVFEQRDFPVNNSLYGWDGRHKGRAPQADVYVYQVEVFCENSEIVRFEGNVTLIL